MSEEQLEANEADSAEQQADLVMTDDARNGEPVPDDVNDADAAEQLRVVPLDEDDYR